MNPKQSGELEARRVGPYLLEGRLGSGGMGTVWRAWDERLRRPVAIKRVLPEKLEHPAARARLRHEAAAGARLNHPAIVHVYDILETGDCEWIVMELVEGRTLKEILREGPLDLVQATRLGREIAKGLGKAHARGVIHRDLKASNVMVTPSGHAKILDFGIAKLLGSEGQDSTHDFTVSQPGALLGTPHAMSPEQVLGWPLDHRSDLFSFGTLLYEMLTQASPFKAENPKATVSRVCRHRQPPARRLRPEIPPELSELADWLLEKEPQHRPQDTREVAGVLSAILARLVQEQSGELPPVLPRRKDDTEESGTIFLGPPQDSILSAGVATGERRQVTVVCCGLMEVTGSWDSATTRFPGLEDLPDVIPELRRLAGEVVERFGGHRGPVLGYFLWIYFGVPQAHGDDARRAVQAAWELLTRVRQCEWSRRGEARLTLRVGVHSGPAVVPKDCPPPEQLALGPTLETATGLQSLAPAGEVLVSEATRRLIARSFETEPLPPVRVPGLPEGSESTAVFRVRNPLDSAEQALRASKALVAREGELDLLFQRWQLVLSGESQVVLVSGEAGIGKSRLVSALREELGALAPRWLFCFGVAHSRSSPFYPVIELLRRNWLQAAKAPKEKLAVLENLLRQYGLPVEEDLPILAALLSLPTPSPLSLAPEAQRQRTLETLFNLLIQATVDQPVVLVVEDLHWFDPSSLELVGALLDGIGDGSLLMILTFRLELELPWGHRSNWTQLSLGRLTDGDILNLIEQVPGAGRLPEKVRREIVAKSDGVPLFVEELTRSAVEADGPSELLGLPGLLRDSLTARLDRLGKAKEVAQIAAVIGRTFSFELLADVSPLDRATLLKELDRLVRAELLVRRGTGERSTYGFKHTLLQEAACELLLPQDLERLHGRIAEALETRFPEIGTGQPERVAFHYTEAGKPEKAIEHWLRAGQRALQRFATQEALEHFRNGLRLVEELPAGPQRDRLELSLRTSSAPAVIASRGHSDDEAEALFDRALALGQQLGDMPNPFQSLLWSFYTWRGDLEKAKDLATQMVLASQERCDVEGLILGLQELATIQAHLGRPRSALRTLRRALELYPAISSKDRDARPPLFSGWDAKCHNLCEAARALADAGYPDRALRYGRRGLRMAESLTDPYSTALAFQYLSFIHYLRREYSEASQHARWMHDLCLNQGFTFFAAHGRFLLSLTRAMQALSENPESPEDAVVQVGEAIQALDVLRRDHRQALDVPELLGWLAEVCVDCGMTSEARWLLEDAFEISTRTGERLGRAELFRLQGRLLLAESAASPEVLTQAEDSFLEARAEAISSGSRWLELRVAMDLARLWHRQGRGEPARDLLAVVAGIFSEGGETADLKAAKALLEELEKGEGPPGAF